MQQGNQQHGIVLVALVLGVGLFALGSTLVVTSGIISQMTKNQNTTSGHHTFYTAEAAAHQGILHYIQDNGEPLPDPLLLNETTAGTIEITEDDFDEYTEALEDGTLGTLAFYCAGPCRRISATVEDGKTTRTVQTAVTTYPAGMAFNFATYAENNLSISGNATIEGNVFANGTTTLAGSANIDGNVFSSGEIDYRDKHVSGMAFDGVEPVDPPEINLQPYRDEAEDADTIFDSVPHAAAFVRNKTQDAIVYVESDTSLSIQGNNTDLTGSLVTETDLSLNGGTYTAAEDRVAIVVLGDLSLAGNVEINGVVYVTGTTTFGTGTNKINGSLISAGGIESAEVTGNTEITYDPSVIDDLYDESGIQGFDINQADSGIEILEWRES